jgi:hypothetical protein
MPKSLKVHANIHPEFFGRCPVGCVPEENQEHLKPKIRQPMEHPKPKMLMRRPVHPGQTESLEYLKPKIQQHPMIPRQSSPQKKRKEGFEEEAERPHMKGIIIDADLSRDDHEIKFRGALTPEYLRRVRMTERMENKEGLGVRLSERMENKEGLGVRLSERMEKEGFNGFNNRAYNAVLSVEDECPIAPPSKPLRYCRPSPFHSSSGERYFYVGEAYGAPVAE